MTPIMTKFNSRNVWRHSGNRGVYRLFLVVLFLLMGCSTAPVIQEADKLPPTPEPSVPPPYLIQPGDNLDIKFFYNPELNETVTVRPDGRISLQLIDDIQAAGRTPSSLDNALTEMYAKELREPRITVIVKSFAGQQVYVAGEVTNQGLVEFRPGMTPLEAVIRAGGFKETAKPEETIVIRKGEDKRPFPIRVDLAKTLHNSDSERNFQLKTYDVVYVPKSGIAKANKFVEQYIQKLLMFRGWDITIGYDLWRWWDDQ